MVDGCWSHPVQDLLLAPGEIYLDNGKQFVSKVFKAEAQKHGVKLIFGRPRNPRGRGKIERYHKTLYRELIALKEFSSLSHFKRELWTFDHQYNNRDSSSAERPAKGIDR